MKLFNNNVERLEDCLAKIDKLFVQLDAVVSSLEHSVGELKKHVNGHGDCGDYDHYE